MGKITAPRPLTQADVQKGFECGQESLNHWFRRHTWGNESRHASRTYVVCDAETDQLAGYVSLATGQIERGYLPKSKQRNMPDPVPVLVLGQLAVDQIYQGQGIGTDLLRYALQLAVVTADSVGLAGVLTHPLTPEARALYTRWGFQEVPGDPKGSLFLSVKQLKQNGF